MNVEQPRLVDDLAGLLAGELRFDPLTLAMYASDGSLHQVPPLAVLFPKSRDDVLTVARYCGENHVPITARGAGTGLTGAALGRGVIVDFSRHMNRVVSIEEDAIRVQPGLVCSKLNDVLRKFGRRFAPDPMNADVTTLGGMLGVDATGPHAVRVGSPRDHVGSIELVLAGGQSLEAAEESLEIPASRSDRTPLDVHTPIPDPRSPISDAKRTIVSKLAKLLRDNVGLIDERQPANIPHRGGYQLRGVLAGNRLNLPRLLAGSEGTLGLFTEFTLLTVPLPPHQAVVLLLFSQIEAATDAVGAIVPLEPSACDLLDRRLLTLARESDPRFAEMISPAAEAAVLVEFEGYTAAQSRRRAEEMVRAVRARIDQPLVAHAAYEPEDVAFLWMLPQRAFPLLSRLPGPTRPLPFVDEVAVPAAALRELLIRAQNVFKKHEVTASIYAHAALGQVQIRPFLPIPTGDQTRRLEELAEDLYSVVWELGGTISAQRGVGLSKTSYLRREYGPLYRVFREIKEIFDPHNLMNPGKIVSDDDHLLVKDLRPAEPDPSVVELQLQWKPADLAEAAARCHGCGDCRTQASGQRMCPLFRVDAVEEATPRAKANLLRNYLAGLLKPDDFTSSSMKRVANLCFNCKQCQLECPSNVNIPQMMIEAKAAYVEAHGLSRPDWILARAHSFGWLGSVFPQLSNTVISRPAFRWWLERFTGIARERKLPPFAPRTFLSQARREMWTRPFRGEGVRPVVYFADYYANHHDPQLGQALVAVLRRHGIPVYVPPRQTASGMALISAGDLDAARKQAERNVRELAELAREGLPILCTEPAAVLALKYEYPNLLDHPDVGVVAGATIEAGAYLHGLFQAGKLRRDFAPLPMDVGYHTPCHLRALGVGTPLRELLGLIPELRVHTIEKGCSGMAGSYGVTRENFRNSIRIGWGLISRMRQGDLAAGVTECSSCKLQMEQGTTTPTIHPLKLLALAYGAMPEIADKLKPGAKRLIST